MRGPQTWLESMSEIQYRYASFKAPPSCKIINVHRASTVVVLLQLNPAISNSQGYRKIVRDSEVGVKFLE